MSGFVGREEGERSERGRRSGGRRNSSLGFSRGVVGRSTESESESSVGDH